MVFLRDPEQDQGTEFWQEEEEKAENVCRFEICHYQKNTGFQAKMR